MGVSEVILFDETIINLREDTIVPKALKKGYTAHNALGESIEGEAEDFEGGIKEIIFNDTPYVPDVENKVKIDEEDPTVGDWAKSESKPSYTPEEVHAVDVNDQFGMNEIDNLFNAVFGNSI